MAKSKEYTLKSILEIKIYILFVLDRVRYPIDYATLTEIIFDTTMSVSIDYDTCIRELADDGMLIADEFDGERYYMISDRGREISAELYDTLDPVFREHTETLVMKHLKLARSGARVFSSIQETPDRRFAVTMRATARQGQIMKLELTLPTRAEAEAIRENFELQPDGVYRGVLFAATGRLGYLS